MIALFTGIGFSNIEMFLLVFLKISFVCKLIQTIITLIFDLFMNSFNMPLHTFL